MRLRLDGLGAWRPGPGTVFEGVNLDVAPGTAVLLAGPNGAGGSTLLACLTNRMPPGVRRVGRVRFGDADLTFAHHDEIAQLMTQVGPGGARSGAPEPLPGVHEDVADSLGLSHGSSAQTNMSESAHIRRRLAIAVSRAPHILLLDQVLGGLESRWKQAACALVAAYRDAGGIVLMAEQDIAHALTLADRVLEFGSGTVSDTWTWRSARLPRTPLQQLAATLGVDAPGTHTVAGLRKLVPQGRLAIQVRPQRAGRSVSLVPVQLGDGRQLAVDDTDPPIFLCDSSDAVDRCCRTLTDANAIARFEINAYQPVARLAGAVDRRLRLPPGSARAALAQFVPTLRPDTPLAQHSTGEQAAARQVVAVLNPSMRLLVEPFACLDAAHAELLARRIHDDWLGGRPALVVTADVEALAWFRRAVVWGSAGVQADGHAGAIMTELPARPLLSQVLAPLAVVNASDVVAQPAGALT